MSDAAGSAPSPADAFGDMRGPLAAETYEIVPADVRPGGTTAGLVLLCDHAGNAFPPGYGTLGLPAAQLERHIAYDIGAAAVVRAMAAQLGAPAVLSRYSRLLIDLNRGADDPTLIMRLSDGAVVPGNHPIDAAEWDKRIRLYYQPYHAAIDRVLAHMLRRGVTPVVVSMHSFTPTWKDVPRPWHVGMLWDRDKRLSDKLITTLAADPALVVGDNQPYTGQLEGDCLYQHATSRGFSQALIEVRQDLIATADGQQAWADRLSRALQAIWAQADATQVLGPVPPVVAIANHRPAKALRPGASAPHMTEERVAAAPA